MEATDANLLRIGDVIKEVKRQIGSLQRQAGKARRYQALHADLRVLDTHHSRRQLDSLEAELARCHAEIARLGESEEASRAKIDNSENQLAERRRALEEVEDQIADGRGDQPASSSQRSRTGKAYQSNLEITRRAERARLET